METAASADYVSIDQDSLSCFSHFTELRLIKAFKSESIWHEGHAHSLLWDHARALLIPCLVFDLT